MELTKKLILMQGIPASGKTTWSKNWVAEDPKTRIRFSNDDIRNMLGVYWVLSRESLVKSIKLDIIEKAMENNFDIVVDNMNLNPLEIKLWEDIVNNWNTKNTIPYKIETHQCFDVSLETCIERDSKRVNPIGTGVIINTFKRYRQYIATELNKKEVTSWKSINTCLKDAIIVDLDATLAFNTSGRPFWEQGCAEGIPKDVIDIRMRELLLSICACSECSFIVLTGKEDLPEIREATSSWLDINWLHPTELIMRPKGDVSKGDLCKFNLYNKFIKDKYNVLAVFEDSKKCVDMWRREGLLCLQPNSGLL